MIIYCCPDLLFASKITATANALGASHRPARNAEMLRNRLNKVDDGKLNEAVTGVVVDLGLGDDALDLVRLVKEHDAALPVVVYGSHVAADRLAQARAAGADFVMANSQFAANLPAILERLKGSEM
ncbi:MAG: hypothetical protein WD042_17275 [Phycisphaeraceae bacterium]